MTGFAGPVVNALMLENSPAPRYTRNLNPAAAADEIAGSEQDIADGHRGGAASADDIDELAGVL